MPIYENHVHGMIRVSVGSGTYGHSLSRYIPTKNNRIEALREAKKVEKELKAEVQALKLRELKGTQVRLLTVLCITRQRNMNPYLCVYIHVSNKVDSPTYNPNYKQTKLFCLNEIGLQAAWKEACEYQCLIMRTKRNLKMWLSLIPDNEYIKGKVKSYNKKNGSKFRFKLKD